MRDAVAVAGMALLFALPCQLQAQTVLPGDTVEVITPNDRARLCPQVNCGTDAHIARVPTGTPLVVQDTATAEGGLYCIRWFAVFYRDEEGWLSEFDTDAAPDRPRRCP